MATIKKTITITENESDWITFQITNGGFAREGEYISELIRRDQNQNPQFLATKAAIEEGLKSGVSDLPSKILCSASSIKLTPKEILSHQFPIADPTLILAAPTPKA